MLMQNFGVTSKEHYGMLWYFLEWSIFLFFVFFCFPFFSVRGLCPHERGDHIFVYPAVSCGQGLGPLWRADSKRCGLSERTHWFCVQGWPIRVKNYICIYAVSKKYRIRVGVTLWHCDSVTWQCWPDRKRELHLPSLKAICVWSVVSAIYDKQARIMVV